MNIKEAKQQIKNAMIAYTTTDEHGRVLIPVQKQRPIFLIGAPGIGKTAIMEQIAQELDLALVSYSMTHHTRQSALGLPFIVEKDYGGIHYKVSEYTMSEIIASIYEAMASTGKTKGILFLDEINCISETLAPSMLQFLQYKTFGQHRVPDGWVIVTAGNPPEYNQSVREFDIVTWDRLKKIEVEADYETWKEYAINAHIHPVVTSYLNIKPSHFYHISTTVDGKSFVTARGWEDLSQMIILYEMNNIEVDNHLMSQYLQDEKIAKDFAHYYQLFHKYQSDYEVEQILKGTCHEDIKTRAKQAKFDERLSLISLIMSQLDDIVSKTVTLEETIRQVIHDVKQVPQTKDRMAYIHPIQTQIETYQTILKQKESAHALSSQELNKTNNMISMLQQCIDMIKVHPDQAPALSVKSYLQMQLSKLKNENEISQNALQNSFTFFEEVFQEGQEILILVTEMTLNQTISKYIYTHGCPQYFKYNKQLLFKDKQNELLEKIDAMNLLDFDES